MQVFEVASLSWLIGIAGFLALWPISLARKDCSIVDFWWGPGAGAMALAVWLEQGAPTNGQTLALLVPILVWSVRLGLQLGLRRVAEGEEDPRYAELRRQFTPYWPIKSLFIVFALQGLLQLAVASSVLAALSVSADGAATTASFALAILALIAVGVQTVSDTQLDIFRHRNPPGRLLTRGLRRWVRYPSYAAEIVFWVSMSLVALGAGILWAPLSAVLVIALIRYVSGVAILEDRLSRTRDGFDAYRSRVPALVPVIRPRSGTKRAE